VSGTLDSLLLVLLVITAVTVVVLEDLVAAAMVFSVYSLIMAVIWARLSAPDVALTEAAVGAGVTTVLFIITIYKTAGRPRARRGGRDEG